MRKSISFLIIFLSCLNIYGQKIIDNGKFFSDSELSKLKTQVEDVQKNTSIEILIYSVVDLNGISAKEFGMDLAKKIPIGKKGVNNGVMIILSKNDKTFQILTEYGLEWILTDEICTDISKKMREYFKKKEFYSGVELSIRLMKEKVSMYDWKINETSLNNLTKAENGKIVKFIYSNNTNDRNYKYAIETDPQFSDDFIIKLKSKRNVFDLYYSKYMNDFIGSILSRKEITIYARMKDYDSRKLELLGIE